jgi:hypothetical protein
MLKRIIFAGMSLFIFSACISPSPVNAQPGGFGIGLMLGEPTGVTAKIWNSDRTAWVIDVGDSYFGEPRVDVDYVWHFNSYNSPYVSLYAAVGGVAGFGEGYSGFFYTRSGDRFYYRTTDNVGFAGRAMLGLNFIPYRTPLEFFAELGPLVGIAPLYGWNLDFALGLRFYP